MVSEGRPLVDQNFLKYISRSEVTIASMLKITIYSLENLLSIIIDINTEQAKYQTWNQW